MRIALAHRRHAATGGTERYLNLLAAHLARRGHDVTIVCRRHEAAPHPDVGFAVLRGPAVGGAWRAWAFARALERHVRGTHYDVVYGLGRTWSQDVIRLGGGCHATYLERAHAAARSPLERVLGVRRPRDRVTLAIEARALAPGAAARVVVNAAMVKRDVMRRYGVPAETIEVIRNGVDLERFRPGRSAAGRALRRERGLTEEHFAILFLGTGFGRKGLDRLIDALPAVRRERPEVHLLVAGRDPAARAYAGRAARRGVAGAVHFLGPRSDPETCYAAADLYALPTRYDPFANATLEALACGLPVVTTEWNGASEILSEGVEGSVLEDAAPPEALARALASLCDRAKAAEAGRAARALAERHGAGAAMEASERVLEAGASRRGARAPAAPSGGA